MSDVPRSLQSLVSTIHTVLLTADVFQLLIKSKSKKGRKRKKEKKVNTNISTTQEDSTEGEYAYTPGSQGARGGCSAETKKQNNRIRHKGKQRSENKCEEGDTRNKRKTTRRKDKTNEKGTRKVYLRG